MLGSLEILWSFIMQYLCVSAERCSFDTVSLFGLSSLGVHMDDTVSLFGLSSLGVHMDDFAFLREHLAAPIKFLNKVHTL